MTDAEKETYIREALYIGAVESAKEIAESIENKILRTRMIETIKSYEWCE